ncbi:MAG TPA: hypothetical protein VLD36_09305 [Burkholderiales bacterium]|nr:hypothetical protein [Burkholderiales bacterium]
MFLLERLISRSCRSLAVMIGCGQRIRAFAGSSEDPDAASARHTRLRVFAGPPFPLGLPLRTFRSCIPVTRGELPAPAPCAHF